MTDLALCSAVALSALFARGEASPVEAVRAVLARLDRLDPSLNALCLRDDEAALAAARMSEARWMAGTPKGPIDGVPTTIKDIILTAGYPTRRGSRAVGASGPWTEDAPVTARLREAGAVTIGKTTTPEFGWKGVTDSPLTGITRNPWATSRTPGGSSGGAAVAAASGFGALHVGTDGGGSIRIPAAFTGIFGLKPSFGRVPAYPASPFGTLSHIGPMTRTVGDAARMLTVMASGHHRADVDDWYALPRTDTDFEAELDAGVAGLRVAYSPRLGFDHVTVHPDIAKAVAEAATVFADLGAVVEEVDPGHPDPREIYVTLWAAGAANLQGLTEEATFAGLDPGLQRLIERGRGISRARYLEAIRHREGFGRHMKAFHATWDLLLCPSLPLPAFEAGRETPLNGEYGEWWDWTPFTYPFNLTQQPAASLPAGLIPTADGSLPIGVQLVGRMHDEITVLRAARAFEHARPWCLPDQGV